VAREWESSLNLITGCEPLLDSVKVQPPSSPYCSLEESNDSEFIVR